MTDLVARAATSVLMGDPAAADPLRDRPVPRGADPDAGRFATMLFRCA